MPHITLFCILQLNSNSASLSAYQLRSLSYSQTMCTCLTYNCIMSQMKNQSANILKMNINFYKHAIFAFEIFSTHTHEWLQLPELE